MQANLLLNNSITTRNQDEDIVKADVSLIDGILSPEEALFLENERHRLNLRRAEADLRRAEAETMPREINQTRHTTKTKALGVLRVLVLGLGTILLIKAPMTGQSKATTASTAFPILASPQHSSAGEGKVHIQKQKQQQWQANHQAVQRMKQAYGEKNWQTVLDITPEIPHTEYWLTHQGVLQMAITAKSELEAQN